MRRCQGRKILIRGNHDKGFSNGALFRAGFEAVYKSYANPFIYYPEGMTAEKISVIINHFPDVCMSDFWTPCLCGHVHDKWEYKCGWLNVGVDVWGFKPVRLDKAVFIWHEVRKFGVNFNI
jgi:calcineurin-like phosphoesterase family protein